VALPELIGNGTFTQILMTESLKKEKVAMKKIVVIICTKKKKELL
jgi:hypothetical protein